MAGLESFIRNNGSMCLMASPEEWRPQDVEALSGHREIPQELADRLARSLITRNDIERDHLSVLAWLMREGRLDTRIIIGPERPTLPSESGYVLGCQGRCRWH